MYKTSKQYTVIISHAPLDLCELTKWWPIRTRNLMNVEEVLTNDTSDIIKVFIRQFTAYGSRRFYTRRGYRAPPSGSPSTATASLISDGSCILLFRMTLLSTNIRAFLILPRNALTDKFSAFMTVIESEKVYYNIFTRLPLYCLQVKIMIYIWGRRIAYWLGICLKVKLIGLTWELRSATFPYLGYILSLQEAFSTSIGFPSTALSIAWSLSLWVLSPLQACEGNDCRLWSFRLVIQIHSLLHVGGFSVLVLGSIVPPLLLLCSWMEARCWCRRGKITRELNTRPQAISAMLKRRKC